MTAHGIVYHRDAIDWQHTGTPHRLDLWRITRRPMRAADLDQMITVLLGALIPGLAHRQEPRTHPYTRHGRQVDVRQPDLTGAAEPPRARRPARPGADTHQRGRQRPA